MIGSICASPMMVQALLEWRDRLVAERMLLRDIIDLEATYGGDPNAPVGLTWVKDSIDQLVAEAMG